MINNTTIVLLLLSVGLFYTFTNVQYQKVKKLYTLAGEYQSALDRVSDIVELRDTLLADYGTIAPTEIERIDKVLPDNIDNVRLALDLDGMAARHGISIQNVQTATDSGESTDLVVLPEYEGAYDRVIVSFGFVSNYSNFVDLLLDLEKSLRIMDIESVAFQTGESNFYDFRVAVETYWLK